MNRDSDRPVVFTPANEPYLGSPNLKAFDDLIIATMELNVKVAAYTHKADKLNDIQSAAIVLIPQGINLSLSTRELIRQAYLFGALTLLRPLTERSMTILYFHKFPDKISIWKNGWKYNERPSLAKIIDEIAAHDAPEEFKNIGRQYTQSLNSVTHGDPASALKNLVELESGKYGFSVGKVLNNKQLCNEICAEAVPQMAILLAMAAGIFPDAIKE